jgi:porphobilinogen synthase
MSQSSYYNLPGSSYAVPTPSHLHASYSHATLRAWASGGASATRKSPLVWPLFLLASDSQAKQPIPSLPGQYRWGVDRLPEALDGPVSHGLRAVLLFGVQPDAARKDAAGSGADAADAPVPAAVRLLRARYPSLLVMVDVCLCGYTSHGHCGVLRQTVEAAADITVASGCSASSAAAPAWEIDNAASVARIAEVALAFARAGAHVIAPSDMMDGRVGAIKAALRECVCAGGARARAAL